MLRTTIIILALGLTACGQKQESVTTSSTTPYWSKSERATKAHIRGLFMVNEDIAWASGTEGTVLRCTDGTSWQDVSVPNTVELDFRDIHAFDSNNAVVISAGNGVSIYRTADGGDSWSLAFEDTNRSVFYDGIDFNTSGVGFAYGDPDAEGPISMLRSSDHGSTWQPLDSALRPVLDSNEAGYAASGTGIIYSNDRLLIATGGGPKSRLISMDGKTFEASFTEIPIGSAPGSGVFSIASLNENVIAVGGDYRDSTNARSNCAISQDGGATWLPITVQNPRGYRSCVAVSQDGDIAIACGRTGSDYSTDRGMTWKPMGVDGYFTCTIYGRSGWAAGRNGKMARLDWK